MATFILHGTKAYHFKNIRHIQVYSNASESRLHLKYNIVNFMSIFMSYMTDTNNDIESSGQRNVHGSDGSDGWNRQEQKILKKTLDNLSGNLNFLDIGKVISVTEQKVLGIKKNILE